MRKLDFTALRATKTIPNLEGGKAIGGFSASLRVVNIVFQVTVGCLLVVGFVLFMVEDVGMITRVVPSLLAGAFGFSILAAVIMGVVLLVQYGSALNKKRLAKLTKFAADNELTLQTNISPTGLRGMIFDDGRDQIITEVLAFPDGIEIGNYRYVTGSGKNQRIHNFGYVRVALNKTLPNMVLDAKSSNFMGITNLPDVFHSSQQLRLEGDFNEHFNLYVPQQYEHDALYVFTPDVMQVLVDSGRKYDMEVVDNELFLYQPTFVDLVSEISLTELFKAVDAIATELRQQTSRYRDERLQATSVHGIATEGRRLKKGVNWIIILFVIAIFAANMLFTFAPDWLTVPLAFGIGVTFWGVVVFAFVSRLRGRL